MDEKPIALTHHQLFDAATGKAICWECLKPIPETLLARNPNLAFCPACAAAIETRRRQRRNH